jgi:outer membrane receptor for ferrienterochelin and colicins
MVLDVSRSLSRSALARRPVALAALLLLAGAQARAQSATAPELLAQASATALPAVTVTATLTEQDARTAPASVTVITARSWRRATPPTCSTPCAARPASRSAPRQVGGRKTLALRGLEGKHTLTLIDGRRISASDDVVGHSDYQYGWLPMSAIERIEVIRGPMSALYGSEALGGVVNMITRQPKDRWIGSVGISGQQPHQFQRGRVHAARPRSIASRPGGRAPDACA